MKRPKRYFERLRRAKRVEKILSADCTECSAGPGEPCRLSGLLPVVMLDWTGDKYAHLPARFEAAIRAGHVSRAEVLAQFGPAWNQPPELQDPPA